MAERVSNSEFLIIEPPLPTDAAGWEVRVISPHDWTTIIGYVRNWRKISGSVAMNDFGSGSIELNTSHPIFSTPFPLELPGTIRQGEFLWQFWRDGVMRHEWISDDESENEVAESYDAFITIAGRTPEKVLSWATHVPTWGERQAIEVEGSPDGGTFQLTAWGEVTSTLNWNASAEEMQTALEELSMIDPGDITVVKEDSMWTIQFQGNLAGEDIPRIQGYNEALTASGGGEPKLKIPEDSADNSWTDISATLLGEPAIASVLAFIGRAQARGTLPFLNITFDTEYDSTGAPWSDLTDVTIKAGETLLGLLQRLSDMLGWEFKMLPNFQLWVAQGGYGAMKAGEVQFFKSGQQKTHSRKSSSRDVVTDVYTQASNFEITHNATTSTVTPWKREVWIEAGGSPSTTSASLVGFATLEVRKNKKVSRTISVPPEMESRAVFIDYNLGDWITIETFDGMEAVEVIGLSFSSSPESEFGLEIVIMSAFEAREVRMQRALEAMGGSAATGGQGSSSTGPAPVAQISRLRDLADVNLGGMQIGDVIWLGPNGWVRKAPVVSFLTDVDLTDISDGKALVYDATAGKWKAAAVAASSVAWTAITGKPVTFPPSTHSHVATDISDSTPTGRNVLTAASQSAARSAIGAGTSSLALGTTAGTAKAGDYAPAWTDVTSKPSTFEPVVKGIDWLSDVDTSAVAPTNGQALVWDNTAGLWKPGTVSGGGGADEIADLTDVDLTGLVEGDVLIWNDTTNKWEPGTVSGGGGGNMEYRGAWGALATAPETIDFEDGIVPGTWTQNNGIWTVDNKADTVGSKTKALKSGVITHSQTTYIEFSYQWETTNDMVIRYLIESELNYDWVRIYVDGVQIHLDSGNTGVWEIATIPMTPGTRTIRLAYSKDGSGNVGGDAVWFSVLNMYTVDPAGEPYAEGHVVEHDGKLWVSSGTPGTGEPGVEPIWLLLEDPAAGGGASELADLTDVDLTGLANGDVLIWDSTASKWEPGDASFAGSPVEGVILTRTLSNSASASLGRFQDFDTTEVLEAGYSVNAGKDTITVDSDGWYGWTGHTRFVAAASSYNLLALYVNGTLVERGAQDNATAVEISASGFVYLEAGDQVQLWLYTSNSAQVTYDAAGTYTRMTLVRLSGTEGPAGPTGPTGADGADGHNPITVSTTAPSSPAVGDIWFDIS